MNTELLERVKQHVLAEPRRVRMEAWAVSLHMNEHDKDTLRFGLLEDIFADEKNTTVEEMAGLGFAELLDFPACGTVACIAGWGKILSQPDPEAAMRDSAFLGTITKLSTFEVAELFGINATEADRLFVLPGWPKAFRLRYELADSPDERARIVAERIDHFIKTNGF